MSQATTSSYGEDTCQCYTATHLPRQPGVDSDVIQWIEDARSLFVSRAGAKSLSVFDSGFYSAMVQGAKKGPGRNEQTPPKMDTKGYERVKKCDSPSEPELTEVALATLGEIDVNAAGPERRAMESF